MIIMKKKVMIIINNPSLISSELIDIPESEPWVLEESKPWFLDDSDRLVLFLQILTIFSNVRHSDFSSNIKRILTIKHQ